jgi:quercetin dioxygenase-like cupin family protein
MMDQKRKAATSTVQIENERVIVTEWRFAPGAETTWHRHEYDIIVIPLTTGKLLIETEPGENIAELVCGKSYSRAKGVEHNVINHNDYEFLFVEIELK